MVAKGEQSSLGYSVFTPGTELQPVCHETEEVAYVVAGAGELRLDDGAVAFRGGRCADDPGRRLARRREHGRRGRRHGLRLPAPRLSAHRTPVTNGAHGAVCS